MSGWWWRLRWRITHPRCMWPGCTRAAVLWYCADHGLANRWAPMEEDDGG